MSFFSKIVNNLFTSAVLERRKVTLSLLEQNPDAKLLDCGCGDGELTLQVAERVGTKQIHGIDINGKKAKAKGINISECDLNEIFPIDSESFHIIFASEIIEHLHNTDLFLKECHRILKKGGYAVIETPNLAALHNIIFLVLGQQPPPATVSDEVFVGGWVRKKIGAEGPGHYRIFTLGALVQLLEYHGFKVERTTSSVFYPFPTPLARLLCTMAKGRGAYIAVKARRVD